MRQEGVNKEGANAMERVEVEEERVRKNEDDSGHEKG